MSNKHTLEHAIAEAMTPAIELSVDTAKRMDALEAGNMQAAGDAAAANLAKMADSFRKASMRVQDLPHIALTVQCVSAFGMSVSKALPEVFE